MVRDHGLLEKPALRTHLVAIAVVLAPVGYTVRRFGLFAPKDTPNENIARPNAATVQALADPAVKTRFSGLGLDVATREQQSPERLAAFHKGEIDVRLADRLRFEH